MENQDKIQDVLNCFVKTPSKDIPPLLEEYLRSVAKTGKTVFPWQQLKTLFIQKLEQVMEQFNKEDPCEHQLPFPNVDNTKYEEMRRRIIDALQRFTGAPFTVQRICELVTQPKKHYTQCDKFLRGIEKNVLVVSTVDPLGRKIVSESRALVNGLDLNGVEGQRDFNDITDEQPFGSGPQVDWSGNNVATVWPVNLASENQSNSNSVVDDSKSDIVNGGSPNGKNQQISENKVEKTSDSEKEESLVVKDSIPKISNQSDLHPQRDENEGKDSESSDQSLKDVLSQDKDTENVTNQSSEQVIEKSVSSDAEIETKSEAAPIDEVKESVCGEKHTRDISETSMDEPPEKKQKMEADEEDVKDDTKDVDEPSQGTSNEEVVSDCEKTKSGETEQTQDQVETNSQESVKLELTQDKDNLHKDDEQTTESTDTTEVDKTDISEQSYPNVTDTPCADMNNTTEKQDISKESDSDNINTENNDTVKENSEQVTDNTIVTELVAENNTGTEFMETDSVAKQDEEVPDTVMDESEPMEHE